MPGHAHTRDVRPWWSVLSSDSSAQVREVSLRPLRRFAPAGGAVHAGVLLVACSGGDRPGHACGGIFCIVLARMSHVVPAIGVRMRYAAVSQTAALPRQFSPFHRLPLFDRYFETPSGGLEPFRPP